MKKFYVSIVLLSCGFLPLDAAETIERPEDRVLEEERHKETERLHAEEQKRKAIASAATTDNFVPLGDILPLEKSDGYKNRHSYQYGLSASNTFINDSALLPKGYFAGSYRPFFNYSFNEKYSFNARGKVQYKNNPSITSAQETQGLQGSAAEYNLELFNTQFDFDRHKITAGRAFYKVGRGLLFSNFADGAEYRGDFKYFSVRGMAAYSGQYGGCSISIGGCATAGDISQKSPYDVVPGRPLDANLPDAGKRLFTSLEIHSPQLYGSSAYAVGLYSRDFSRDASSGTLNKGNYYTFDPLYMGLGLSGYILTPRLRYVSEFIYETGRTYNSDNTQTNISAWGLTADVNYTLPWLEALFKPGLIFQYATASGRKSATASAANPSHENAAGSDNSFYYFGVYSAGLALKPKLANLHVFRLGFQFRPLNHYYFMRNLMIAFKYTYYLKANSDYAISDPNATAAKSVVGQGIDTQLVWDFRSDVKLYYAYGVFLPSEAYTAAKAQTLQIHIVSLSLLF